MGTAMQRQSQTERQKKKRIFFYSSSLKYFVISSYIFLIYHGKQGKEKSQEKKTFDLTPSMATLPPQLQIHLEKWEEIARSLTNIPTLSSSLSLTKESSQVFSQFLRSFSILYPYSRILFSDIKKRWEQEGVSRGRGYMCTYMAYSCCCTTKINTTL